MSKRGHGAVGENRGLRGRARGAPDGPKSQRGSGQDPIGAEVEKWWMRDEASQCLLGNKSRITSSIEASEPTAAGCEWLEQ